MCLYGAQEGVDGGEGRYEGVEEGGGKEAWEEVGIFCCVLVRYMRSKGRGAHLVCSPWRGVYVCVMYFAVAM